MKNVVFAFVLNFAAKQTPVAAVTAEVAAPQRGAKRKRCCQVGTFQMELHSSGRATNQPLLCFSVVQGVRIKVKESVTSLPTSSFFFIFFFESRIVSCQQVTRGGNISL